MEDFYTLSNYFKWMKRTNGNIFIWRAEFFNLDFKTIYIREISINSLASSWVSISSTIRTHTHTHSLNHSTEIFLYRYIQHRTCNNHTYTTHYDVWTKEHNFKLFEFFRQTNILLTITKHSKSIFIYRIFVYFKTINAIMLVFHLIRFNIRPHFS